MLSFAGGVLVGALAVVGLIALIILGLMVCALPEPTRPGEERHWA